MISKAVQEAVLPYVEFRFSHKTQQEQAVLVDRIYQQLKDEPKREAKFLLDVANFMENNAEFVAKVQEQQLEAAQKEATRKTKEAKRRLALEVARELRMDRIRSRVRACDGDMNKIMSILKDEKFEGNMNEVLGH